MDFTILRRYLFTALAISFALMSRHVSAACSIRTADYINANTEKKTEILNSLINLGDEGLPCLKQLLPTKVFSDYEHVLSSIANIRTEKAAALIGDELYSSNNWNPRVPAGYLAQMGKVALPQLIKISQKTVFTMTRSADDLPIHPHFTRPLKAVAASDAIALINDPAAAKDLGNLLNDKPYLARSGLEALANIHSPEYKDQAAALFRKDYVFRIAALKYLRAINREKYRSLLIEHLSAIDDSSKAHALFELGGDASQIVFLSDFVSSDKWTKRSPQPADRSVTMAILALGMSHDIAAQPILLKLLKNNVEADPLTNYDESKGLPARYKWPRIIYYGTTARTKQQGVLPLPLLAAIALGELNAKSAIAAINEAAIRFPYLKSDFDVVLAHLSETK